MIRIPAIVAPDLPPRFRAVHDPKAKDWSTTMDDGSMRAVLAHCASFPLQTFAPGEVLIAEGPATDRLFFLVDGEVEVLRGETQIADIAEPGAIFGEIAALLGGNHTASVRAVTAVTVHRLDDASAALKTPNVITFHVAANLARRLTDATAYLADIKRQFADRSDHLGMVDEVLEALVQRQRPSVTAGSSLTSEDGRL